MWRDLNLHILLVKMQNGMVMWENSLADHQKVKCRVIIWDPAIPLQVYIFKRNENICLCKNLQANAHSSIIHRQKMETTQMPINQQSTNMWHNHMVDYYPATNRKYWYNLQHGWTLLNTMLSKRSPTRKSTILFHPYLVSRINKSIETESRLVVTKG